MKSCTVVGRGGVRGARYVTADLSYAKGRELERYGKYNRWDAKKFTSHDLGVASLSNTFFCVLVFYTRERFRARQRIQ